MASDVIAGRVWRFGDDVSTDLLSPGEYAIAPLEVRKHHCLESLNPRFPDEVAQPATSSSPGATSAAARAARPPRRT